VQEPGVQETAFRNVLSSGEVFGVRMIDQVPPFHRSTRALGKATKEEAVTRLADCRIRVRPGAAVPEERQR
jgi:hypothetical protein